MVNSDGKVLINVEEYFLLFIMEHYWNAEAYFV